MFCTNCGRELKDEDVFCTNCGMKIKKEEKATSQKKKIKKGVFFLVIVCLIVSVVLVRNNQVLQTNKEQTTDVESKPSSITNTEDSETEEQINSEIGNSVGNITNGGCAVAKDDFIYYIAPSEDTSMSNIYKVKKGSSDFEVIFKGGNNIRALNIIGDNLYFINILNQGSSNDEVDNKIYKMNLDGSNATVINDNDFAYDCYYMYALNNALYYVGVDGNICKMDLNGRNRQIVVETNEDSRKVVGLFTINDKYIIYGKGDKEGTYIIRSLDGNYETQIKDEGNILSSNIIGNSIYYLNGRTDIVKSDINGEKREILYEEGASNINIYKDNIYYLNYTDETNEKIGIYKINIGGGEPKLIKELEKPVPPHGSGHFSSTCLNIVGDYIYYIDINDKEEFFINLINVNDFSEIKLCEWNYK